jgi:hypothetical protein
MFGLFKSAAFSDAILGELQHKGGVWRGTVTLGEAQVPLAILGSRSSPDNQALEIARAVPASYPKWQAPIAEALFDHYSPYAEAVASGELEQPEEDMPRLAGPEEVWSWVTAEFIAVLPLDGELCVEIGYAASWDEEHTLGARLRDGQLIELNGSVLAP